jgi:hypothetical protein
MSGKTEPKPLGIFDPALLYTAEAVKQLCTWGEWAFRQNRRKGLRTLAVGKTIFVRGSDLIEFVESHGTENGGSP